VTPPFLQRLFLREDAELPESEFPANLPFVRGLDIPFTSTVTFFVGENGSGKSTMMEAIAELCGLPPGGGGRNELADTNAPHTRSELAPFLRGAFRKKPRDGYFFRAEFQAHFASLLEQRRADPEFKDDPYARYGGRSLHTRSHGEAFLEIFAAWLNPGMILMDEPEAALEDTSHFHITKGILDSPQRYWKHLLADEEDEG
jgi:predicted ATPase